MRGSWILFLSSRYLYTRRRGKGKIAFILSITGVALGIMTLITVLSVMNGLQKGFINTILEVGSYHLRMKPERDETVSIKSMLDDYPEIRSVTPFSDLQTLAHGGEQSGLLVRAVPLHVLEEDHGFRDSIVLQDGHFDLSRPENIVLGVGLAWHLKVFLEDTITVFLPTDFSRPHLKPRSFTVVGTFRSGNPEYDRNLAFISLDALSPESRAGNIIYGIKLKNHFDDLRPLSSLTERYPSSHITSWRSYNHAFFSALRIEKLTIMILVNLVFVVVAFNIYYAFKRSIVERTTDIALLRAAGATPAALRAVFLTEGLLVSLIGGGIGILLGYGTTYFINEIFWGIEKTINLVLFFLGVTPITIVGELSSARLPAVIVGSDVLAIFLVTLFAILLSALLASRRILTMEPAEVLRYE